MEGIFIFECKSNFPPLWNFHKFYVHPPYPLEKDSFGKKVC